MQRWTSCKYVLEPPSLKELSGVIDKGLKENSDSVSVEVTACPDLRQSPFSLASEGLSGNERIVDVGGPQDLHPLPRKDHKYSTQELLDLVEMKDGLLIGAAGPFHHVGVNAELMLNLKYATDGQVNNQSRIAKIVEGQDGSTGYACERLPYSTDCALLANIYASDGALGNVIMIVTKGRTGPLSFTEAVRAALKARYSDPVSLGGVFVIRRGRAKLHIMPDFREEPRVPGKEDWLKFFEMDAPLTCLSVFHARDPNLHLHPDHTHCFSEHGQGGHYHYDTTTEEVEYAAYFNTAKVIFRIDGPDDDWTGWLVDDGPEQESA